MVSGNSFCAFYLFLTMLLGGHFTIGYVWILPDGGYEFGMFWAIITAVFIVTGGWSHFCRQSHTADSIF